MDNLNGRFYNNQEIVLETPHKKFKGYINKIEDGFLYIILYASFTDRQTFEFSGQDYDISGDFSQVKNSSDFILISPGLYETLIYNKPLLKDAVKNAGNISLKIQITGAPVKREGREFLRINTAIQFIYEEITIEEFLETKDGYTSRPSFTTSVYGIYNIAGPKTYQSAGEGEEGAPVNPRMERLLIAINSKLDVILSLLNPEASIFADVKERQVSISGSGIMWKNADERLKPGSIIKITMLFPAVPLFVIKAVAQVVKISFDAGIKTAGADSTAIACKFIAINESDRDEIIKFTLEKQRQQIKKSAS
ncbi:MAG: PilZ domain-containing protein [bacterium]